MLLEKEIEGPVCKWAKDHNFLVVKVKFLEIGYPDRLFISPSGHTIFIEFKRPGKKPEVIQNYRLSQLRRRNIPAYWADTYIEAVNILKASLESEELPETSNPLATISSLGGTILGSRVRENIRSLGFYKDSPRERSDPSSPDSSPAPADDGDVA